MGVSTIVIVILLVLFVTLSISLIIVSNLRPNMYTSLSPSSGSMSQTNIGSPTDVRNNFMTPPSSTILVYINYKSNNKTSTLSNNRKPLRILELQNSLRFELIPGNMKSPQSTQLTIQTRGENNVMTYESFPIKGLPQQKWIHLVIVKEGRRYTVYYNGVAVFSERTKHFPTINSSQFIIGDNELTGVFALPRIAPTEYRIDNVLADLAATSDTRHKPYLPTDSIFPQFVMPSFGCPNGIFCFSTSSPPIQNPLKQWKTPYA
jgi:hypothetical protein